jgi:hypothetical protein
MENKPQLLELADVFSQHAEAFLQKHSLCASQFKAFNDIIHCRSSYFGGHLEQCNHCGHTRPAYNSCSNRHCPKCQFVKKEKWVDQLASHLPSVKHFHLVFTIPACLHKLFYINQTECYNLMFKASGKALLQTAANPRFLGAQAGAVAVLHTWGQTLTYHPHIHMIVPAGGLSADWMEWVHSGNKFFLPVKVLSRVFRSILCKYLEEAIGNQKIKLPESEPDFGKTLSKCFKKNWVVYCEKPFSDNQNLIGYLGNYTHRVAISNHRLLSCDENKVSFSYKDYSVGGLQKTMSLDSHEFIRRFLRHVLPSGFCKIRYFGFMALCNRSDQLQACYSLIPQASYLPALSGLSALEIVRLLTNLDPLFCPKCKQGMMKPVKTSGIEINSTG